MSKVVDVWLCIFLPKWEMFLPNTVPREVVDSEKVACGNLCRQKINLFEIVISRL